jgi:Spherulation-specific family 4
MRVQDAVVGRPLGGIGGAVTNRSGTTDGALRPTLGHIIPMYVYPANLPDGSQGEDAWKACPDSRADDAVTYVIANVANGVAEPDTRLAPAVSPGPGAWSVDEASAGPVPSGDLVDPHYRRAIASCSGRGARLLGYVNLEHGTAPLGSPHSTDPATVLGQVRLWFELYPGIQGVFLDQVTTAGTFADRRYHREIARNVPGTIVTNAGQLPSSDWLLESGSEMVVYENYLADFQTLSLPSWASRCGGRRLGAILHDAISPSEVAETCAEARAKGFGFVYVTDGRQDSGNPYDGLPSPPIWEALLTNR